MPSRTFNTGDNYTSASEVFAQVPRDTCTIVVTNAEVTARFAVDDNPSMRAQVPQFNSDEKPGMIPGVWSWTKADFGGAPIVGVTVRSSVAGQPASVTVHI